MLDEILGGVLGGGYSGPTIGAGAAAQQANAEAFERIRDSWIPAPPFTPEQEAEYMRLMMNAQPAIVWKNPPPELPSVFWRKRLIRDALSHAENRLFRWLLAGMALALAVRYWMRFARSAS